MNLFFLPIALFVFVSCSRETPPPTTPAQPPTVEQKAVGEPNMPAPVANDPHVK